MFAVEGVRTGIVTADFTIERVLNFVPVRGMIIDFILDDDSGYSGGGRSVKVSSVRYMHRNNGGDFMTVYGKAV